MLKISHLLHEPVEPHEISRMMPRPQAATGGGQRGGKNAAATSGTVTVNVFLFCFVLNLPFVSGFFFWACSAFSGTLHIHDSCNLIATAPDAVVRVPTTRT
jgi:hypothetical protein